MTGNLGYGLTATIDGADIRLTAETGDWVVLNREAWGNLVKFAQSAGFVTAAEADAEDRRTALLAAAQLIASRPDSYEIGYEEQDVTHLARKFEPYLRGDAK